MNGGEQVITADSLLKENGTTVEIPDDEFHVLQLKIEKVHTEEYKDHVLRPYKIAIGLFLGYVIINEISKKQMYNEIKSWSEE